MFDVRPVDTDYVRHRAAQFRAQVARRLDGSLTEDEFRPLRLMNGVYLQLHAYMLRVAIPYGTISPDQMRTLALLAEKWDKGYGHWTTRQNIQFNWPKLVEIPDMLDKLASVGMHAIQTSGNTIRNVTTDAFAGAAADEYMDPRPYAELLRSWSTDHAEFQFLPRKFKIAVSGGAKDRAVIPAHDIGLRLKRQDGTLGFEVWIGGGLGRILGGAVQQAGGDGGDLAGGVHGQLDGGQVAAGGARLDHGAVGAAGRGVVLVELVGVGVEDDVHGGGGLADDAVELGPGRPLGGQLARAGGAVVVRGHDHVGGVLGLQLVRDRVHGGDLVEDLVALQARAGGGRVQLVGGGADDRDAHAVDVEDGVRGEDGLLARRVHQVGGEHRELGPGLHTALQVVQALVELVVAGGERVQAERVHHVDRRVVLLHVGHGLRAADQVAGAGQQRGAGAVLGLERGAVVLHGVRELRADVVRGQRAVEVVEGQDRDGGLVRGGRLDGQGGRRARGREDEDGAGGRGDGTAAEQAGHGSPRDA